MKLIEYFKPEFKIALMSEDLIAVRNYNITEIINL
jgi:hypothetical protein